MGQQQTKLAEEAIIIETNKHITERKKNAVENPTAARFRQISRFFARNESINRIIPLFRDLIEETKLGGGFLAITNETSLEVLENCIQSKSETLKGLACQLLIYLGPDEEKFTLWFGITSEHLKWAEENCSILNLEAKKMLALNFYASSFVAEEIVDIIESENVKNQDIAFQALSTILLHPNVRESILINSRRIQKFCGFITKLNQPVGRNALKVIDAWSLTYVPSLLNIPSFPVTAELIYERLLTLISDTVETTIYEEGVLISILRILYIFSTVISTEEFKETEQRLINGVTRFLRHKSNRLIRILTYLILLNVTYRDDENLKINEFDFDTQYIEVILSQQEVSALSLSPTEKILHLMLKTCIISLIKYDKETHDEFINFINSMNDDDASFNQFWIQHLTMILPKICISNFLKFSNRLLVLPKLICLSLIMRLENSFFKSSELLLNDIFFRKIFACVEGREFAITAMNYGICKELENKICQFVYQYSEVRLNKQKILRKEGIICCKYLVSCFICHSIMTEHDSFAFLEEFLIARLHEVEDWKNENQNFDEDLLEYIFLLRLGLCILYPKQNYKFSAFRNASGIMNDEQDQKSFVPFARRSSSSASSFDSPRDFDRRSSFNNNTTDDDNQEKMEMQEDELDHYSKTEKYEFIHQLITFHYSDDLLLKFATSKGIESVIKMDEKIKNYILENTPFLSEQFMKEDISTEDLMLLKSFVIKPGNISIWLDFTNVIDSSKIQHSNSPSSNFSLVPNRSGGRAASVIFTSSVTTTKTTTENLNKRNNNKKTTNSSFFCQDKVILLPQPSRSGFFVGGRVIHENYSLGTIVKIDVVDNQQNIFINFDSGLQTYFKQDEELKRKIRFIDTDFHSLNEEWTIVLKINSELAEEEEDQTNANNFSILCQGLETGDIQVGSWNKNLGSYDGTKKIWYPSSIFLQSRSSNTIVVIGRKNQTNFYLVDENNNGEILESSYINFQSKDDIFSIGNGIKGKNPFPPLSEFIYYTFAWDEKTDFKERLSLSKISSIEFARKYIANYNNGKIVEKLHKKLLMDTTNNFEKRQCLLILCNLAICCRSQVLNYIGAEAESFLRHSSDEYLKFDSESLSRLLCVLSY